MAKYLPTDYRKVHAIQRAVLNMKSNLARFDSKLGVSRSLLHEG